jgi:cytochrome o ubiquinol oxidase subunit 1
MNLLGNLSWSAIPFHEPIVMGTSVDDDLGIVSVLGWIVLKGHWPYLWREWLTSVDHKRIGVMYIVLGAAHAAARLRRCDHDARPASSRRRRRARISAPAPLRPDFLGTRHYHDFLRGDAAGDRIDELCGPLQLGVRDVAFPTLNSVSLWLTATGILLTNISLVVGEFAKTGWVAYPPLSELEFSPGVGVDYYLWALQISGIGTLLTGINFVTTILKLRAPGMSYMRMPVFCWTAFASNLLIVAAFPVLTATFAMLLLDRYLGFHFFSVGAGGNPMMYVNLFWIWGHPEVYILVLPAFGVFSEVTRPSPASRCSATAPWWLRPWRSAFSLTLSGCTTSSPWGPAQTSTPSSAS